MPMDATQQMLKCVVVTPERGVLDESVEFVVLPMYDGELGVLPGRAPLIGRLGYGELRMRRGTVTRRFYVDGGFAQVRSNVVTVLTARALPAEEINIAAAEQALREALSSGTNPQDQEKQLRGQQRAQAQLRIAQRTHAEPGAQGHA
jgi:F-type H+-transporting ATPase subunit epsilon